MSVQRGGGKDKSRSTSNQRGRRILCGACCVALKFRALLRNHAPPRLVVGIVEAKEGDLLPLPSTQLMALCPRQRRCPVGNRQTLITTSVSVAFTAHAMSIFRTLVS